jgi:hypothetical protein
MGNYRQDREYNPENALDYQTLVDTSYRGLASALGSPVDIFSSAMRPFGYGIPEEDVVMSSEWISKQMEDSGLISNARNQYAEFAAAMMIPDPTDIATASKFLGATLVPGMAKHLDDVPINKYTEEDLTKMIEDGKGDELDRIAFGVNDGDKIDIDTKDINLIYPDIENAEYKSEHGGMDWVNSVDLSEPIDISVDELGRFNLEDGHHRYFAAKMRGEPLTANVELKGNPIRAILKRQGEGVE